MPALAFLIAWANAPFAIAVGIAAMFALLQVTGLLGVIAGGGGDGSAENDADIEHDLDAEADHDLEGEHDPGAGGTEDTDGHEGHEHESGSADRGLGAAALAPLGFGKIPFSIIWQTYALAFAATGFALNLRYLGFEQGVPLATLAWTLPASLAVGYVSVAVVARLLGPVLSSSGHEATSRAQLVGQVGVVISSKVDEEFGEVRIRDKTGHDLRVICKLNKGTKRLPTENQSVVVVDYERGDLLVEPLELDDEDEASGGGRKAV